MKEKISNLKVNFEKIKLLGNDLSKTTKRKIEATITAVTMLFSGGCGPIEEETTPAYQVNEQVIETQIEETNKTIEEIIEESEILSSIENKTEESKLEESKSENNTIIEESNIENISESEIPTEKETSKTTVTIEKDNNKPEVTEVENKEEAPVTKKTTVTIEKTQVTTIETEKPKETTKKTTVTIEKDKNPTTSATEPTEPAVTMPPETEPPVTTTTTPITEPPVTEPIVTEPPVTKPVWRDPDDYRLEEIVYDGNAFTIIADRLKNDILNGNGIEMEYGCTFGGTEAAYILALLNPNMINDDVLRLNLGFDTADNIKEYTKFVYMINWLQEACGTDVDFEKYTLDPSIGQFLNSIDDSYRNGTINEVLNDIFVNGNIAEEYMYSPSILPIISSYDRNSTYVNSDYVNEICLNSFNDNLFNTLFGYSYTR